MVLNNPPQKTLEEAAVDTTRTSVEPESIFEPEEEEVDVEELERLESEAKKMAKKILEYRATIPNQLEVTLASVLSAQRSSLDPGSDSGPVGELNPDLRGEQVKPSKSSSVTEGDQRMIEKARLLKDKISSNVSAMPSVLKRLKECISKINLLDSYDGTIHPVFKKKKPS